MEPTSQGLLALSLNIPKNRWKGRQMVTSHGQCRCVTADAGLEKSDEKDPISDGGETKVRK